MKEKDLKRKEMCEFRYSIIAELENPYLCRGELKLLIKEKALREYDIPHSGKTNVTEATIRKWLCLYRKYGKEGLYPKVRSDNGVSRSIPQEEVAVLLNYLEEHPKVTATAAYKLLKEKGEIKTDISSSTLSRIIVTNGQQVKKRIKRYWGEKNIKLNFLSQI